MLRIAVLLGLSALYPVDVVRRSAEYELELVGKDSVRVALDARIWLRGGGTAVRVCDAGLALATLRVDGRQALPVVRDDAVFVTVTGPGEHRLSLEGIHRIDPELRPRGVILDVLRSAAVKLRFKLPSKNVDVSVEPAVKTERVTKDGTEYFVAHLPSTDLATVQWRERVAEERGPPVVYATCGHRVKVGRAAVSGLSAVTLDIAKGKLASAEMDIREGVSILSVGGKAVRDWQVESKRLTVFFDGEQEGSVKLTVGFEIPVGKLPAPVDLPPFRVRGVNREQGTLSVTNEQGVVATLGAIEGIKQEFSRKAAVQQFSYAATPAKASFNVEEPTRLDVRLHAEISGLIAVGDAAEHCTAIIKYNIFGVPVSELRFALPAEATLQDVAGTDVVTTDVVTEGDRSMATVKLGNPRTGEYELVIRYERLQPETAAEFELPFVTVPDAVALIARVGVCSVTNAEVVPVKSENAQRMPPREVPPRVQAYAEIPLLFGFKYNQSPHVVLAVKRHGEIQTTDAVVDLVESTSVLTRDGTIVTKELYIIRNRGRQFLALEFADDVSVWSLLVAGRPVKPGNGGRRTVLIPLIRSARKGNVVMPISVEIVWETARGPLGSRGRVKTTLPRVDANVLAVQWGIYTPSEYKFKFSKSRDTNMQKFVPTQRTRLLAEGVRAGADVALRRDAPATAAAKPAIAELDEAEARTEIRRRGEKRTKGRKPARGVQLEMAPPPRQRARRMAGKPGGIEGKPAERYLGEKVVSMGKRVDVARGLLAPPIDLALDGDFHYFRKTYPGGSEEPPFVRFKYRKRFWTP